jgi:phthalate 4,5-cis-dihydrodiol dehydrogenase
LKQAAKLRLGLVGLGTAGRSVAEAACRVPGWSFVAGADLRAEAREDYRARYGIDVFETASQLSARRDVDVVYVATPNYLHAEHAIAALESGKHVIVEKPMALTLEQCDAMIATAEKNGAQIMVAHTRSFNPPIRKMREIIASRRLGRVIQINTLRYSPWLVRPRLPEEVDTRLGGGVCYRQAPHQVDIVRLLGGGLVKSVRASAGAWDPKNATEGNYTALLEFENHAAATLVYNGYGYFDDAEVTTRFDEAPDALGAGARLRRAQEAGALTKDASRSGLAFEIERGAEDPEGGPRQPFFGLTVASCERGDLRQSKNGVLCYDEKGVSEVGCPDWEGPLTVELRDFHEALAAGRPVAHDGRWGKATLEVCLALLQSSREKREVPLFHQVESPY